VTVVSVSSDSSGDDIVPGGRTSLDARSDKQKIADMKACVCLLCVSMIAPDRLLLCPKRERVDLECVATVVCAPIPAYMAARRSSRSNMLSISQTFLPLLMLSDIGAKP
jgi:hypothetical protein